MRRACLAACAVLAACHPHAPPSNSRPPDAGISIAIYAGEHGGYAVVDDRRMLDVSGSTVLLSNIDPGAELASLVLEPADPALHIGPCVRERMPDVPAQHEPRFVPVVQCTVTAPPGRYLVRILYVTPALVYRAQHDVDVRGERRARIASRYAITTPVWHAQADVALYDGVPGGPHAPREVARGTVALDGSVAVIAAAPRDVDWRLRRIYEGAVVTSEDSTDPAWGRDSVQAVWVWLALAKLRLAPGPVHVHLELAGEGVHELDVAPASRRQADEPDAPLRLPLWVDESLRGSRQRILEYNDGAMIVERCLFGVANTGESTREVWIEEPMRRAARRRLDRAWPVRPLSDDDVLRMKLVVRPGPFVRAGYTLTYEL